MNKIYWGKDEIVMLTDHLNAVSHRHLMLQLFLGLEDDVKIHIRGRSVTESCVITGNDVAHAFFANKKPHLSVLFEPVSAAALQIEAKMNGCDYLAFGKEETEDIRRTAGELSDIRGSLSFKIGRIITFIPRKIRGAIRCCKENGLIYTVKRVFKIIRK